MLRGDRVALAKLISRIENNASDVASIMAAIYPHVGRAKTIGVTGPPGAGKSTLVDRLVERSRKRGESVGVIAVDPSSPFSGGAILGDRIRMQDHCLDPEVFIRSLSTRGRRGGLARASRQVAHLLDAFGKDTIFIETVGVGQTELDIMELARTVLVVLVPEAGDTVQVMKAGLLEIAHVFIVNKADRDGAMRMQTELEMMLQLHPEAAWTVPVLLTKAAHDQGIDAVMEAVERHDTFQTSHAVTQHAPDHREHEFLEVLGEELRARVDRIGTHRQDLIERVRRGDIDPYSAALEILQDQPALTKILGADQ